MKRVISLLACCLLASFFCTGCYVYTNNPPPRPAIVINPPAQPQTQPQTVQEPEQQNPPPMPPHGAVGRPVN